ncbi:MAG: head GIN domain-containing protein [Alistipes sp.]
MKKTLAILVALGFALQFSACTSQGFQGSQGSHQMIKGSKNLITKTIAVPDFSAIQAHQCIQVIIADSLTDRITVKADDNIMDYVVITATNGILDLSIAPKINGLNNVTIEVTVPNNGHINRLEAHSSAGIIAQSLITAPNFEMVSHSSASIKGRFKTTSCSMESHSSSEIDVELNTDKAFINLQSSAEIDINGSARYCKADLSSSSELNAKNFRVENYQITTSSSADADINCTTKLVANASSSSSITYTGGCSQIEFSKSSAASISSAK